jgi:hypothetical protein
MTTEFSETGHQYQLIVRSECGPLMEWLFGDAAIETASSPVAGGSCPSGGFPLDGRGTP